MIGIWGWFRANDEKTGIRGIELGVIGRCDE